MTIFEPVKHRMILDFRKIHLVPGIGGNGQEERKDMRDRSLTYRRKGMQYDLGCPGHWGGIQETLWR